MLISFSIQKDLIYIPIFIIINAFYYESKKKLQLTEEFNLLIIFCSKIILIIFYSIEKCLSKKETINIENKNKNIENENNENKSIQTINYEKLLIVRENNIDEPQTLLILLISLIFSFLSYYHLRILIFKVEYVNECIIVILFLFFLDSILFKKEIYSHQILSIIIIIVGTIFYYIPSKFDYKISYFIFLFLKYYCRAFDRLMIRYISINKFINIFLIAFILGVSGILYILIRVLINHDFIKFSDFTENIFILSIYFISSFITYFIYYKIIYKLGPIHAYISDFIGLIISDEILQIGKSKRENINFQDLIIMIVFVISLLIYSEIIQLNFCSLNENTKKMVRERAIKDSNFLMINPFFTDSKVSKN